MTETAQGGPTWEPRKREEQTEENFGEESGFKKQGTDPATLELSEQKVRTAETVRNMPLYW